MRSIDSGRGLNRAVAEYLARVDRVQQLVVLRTGPGQAQLLGVALDSARLPEVVGREAKGRHRAHPGDHDSPSRITHCYLSLSCSPAC